MAHAKLQDPDEFRRWYQQGRPYKWIIEQYAKKYNIEIRTSTIGNWRTQLGITERRRTRHTDLVPWEILPEHRYHRFLTWLRQESTRRGGGKLKPDQERRLDWFLDELKELNAVIHYDPETEDGFHLVGREAQDTDIIRKPRSRPSHPSRD